MRTAHEEAARATLHTAATLLSLRHAGRSAAPHAGQQLLAAMRHLNLITPVIQLAARPCTPPPPPPPFFLFQETPSSRWLRDEARLQQEIRGSKELLLEVLKRAAHDWVLYRLHTDLQQRQLAEEAYIWLFEEAPGHPHWIARMVEFRAITGFVTICELLDLDPDQVRHHIRKLRPEDVRNAGRPPERRRLPAHRSYA